MKFEEKISGTAVTNFNITPLFESQFVWLSEIMRLVHKQETMNFLLDNFRFSKGYEEKDRDWVAILDYDTIYKVTIMEKYPEYKEELIDYFGENWLRHYIRFNH